ncbi:hypothetical protein IG536_16750 [Vibrio cholerae]|nr:hypothetical protein [Vibrio cholerae]
MKNVLSLACLLAGALMFPLNAYAYLDPGTGSALLQGIIGAIAAIGVVLKLYWHRLLRMFGLRKTPPVELKTNAPAEESKDKSAK